MGVARVTAPDLVGRRQDLPDRLGLGLSALIVGAVLLSVVYFYAAIYIPALSSDATLFAILADHLARVGRPVSHEFYYPNSDLILSGPHLVAFGTNALLGFGPESARLAAALTLVIVFVVFFACLRHVTGDALAAAVGAAVALAPWSTYHIEFVHLQTGYALHAAMVFAMLVLYVRVATAGRGWPLACAVIALLAFLFFAANPVRGVVFLLPAVLVVEAWLALRAWRRPSVGPAPVAFLAGAALGAVAYYAIIRTGVTFAVPAGFTRIDLDPARLRRNLATLATLPRALFPGFGLADFTLYGTALLAAGTGYALWLGRSRAALLALLLALGATCGAVLAAGLAAGIFSDTGAIRYFMPALLPLIGLAAALAVASAGRRWRRAILAALALPVVVTSASIGQVWSIPRENGRPGGDFALIAEQLTQRGIRLAFAQWEANVVHIHGRGAYQGCFVTFRQALVPFKWNSPHACYDPARMPPDFAIVFHRQHRDTRLPPTLETLGAEPHATIAAGDYDILLFRTAEVMTRWLDYPLAEGAAMRFPHEDVVTHPQMFSRGVERDVRGGTARFLGGPDEIVYGPYVVLPAGTYSIAVFGRDLRAGPQDLVFFVNATEGIRRVAETRFGGEAPEERELARLTFRLRRATAMVHFAVQQAGHGQVTLTRYRIERVP